MTEIEASAPVKHDAEKDTLPEELEHRDGDKTVIGDMTANQVAEAYEAALTEHRMKFWDACKAYKKALFWTLVMGMAIIMESYDTILVGSFYALPAFQKRFGHELPDGSYQLTAGWQSALSNGSNIGIIIGIFANGFFVDRFGHRKCVCAALVVAAAFITVLFCAQSAGMLFAGQILMGLPLGTINTIAPAYAIEVAPLALRHYGPTYVNLCWVFGHILGAGILRGFVHDTTNWAWRIPYAVQWAWPAPLFVLLIFAPDSPWWLCRKDRFEEARRSLDRLSDGSVDNVAMMSMIRHTIEIEKALDFGGTYADCFKGTDLRRTEIACMTWAGQTWTQFALATGVYFFEVAGLDPEDAFDLNIGQYSMAAAATMINMGLLQRYGRRTLWFVGLWGMLVCCSTVGILALIPKQTPAVIWWGPQGVFIMVRFFAYGIATGPIPFVYCSEIGSVKLRQKTIALSRNAFNITSVVSSAVGPFLLNPTAANLKGKSAWISVGFCIIYLIWSYYRFPETKGRSFEELDILFAKKVPARQFSTYKIDIAEHYGANGEEVANMAAK